MAAMFMLAAKTAFGDAPCPPHGPVQAHVAPHVAVQRIVDQLFSELAKKNVECPARDQDPIVLMIEWPAAEHVLVRFETHTQERVLTIERDVNLVGVPPDGIALAVAIVADEMLGEVFERLATAPRSPPAQVAPALRAAGPARAPKQRPLTFGLALTLEQLLSGISLTGVDLELDWRPTPHFEIGVHGGPRAVTARDGGARGYSISAVAVATTNAADEQGIGLVGAVELLGLEIVASVAPSVGVHVWRRFGGRFLLTMDLRGGALLGKTTISQFSGAIVAPSIGLATEW